MDSENKNKLWLIVVGLALFICIGIAVNKFNFCERPNLILISIDTLRSDHCSVYGYYRDTTPNLCKFAEQGVTFDLAYSPSDSTGPSHATMFTSLYPMTHQLVKNGAKLSPRHKTLAERLKAQGYHTAAVIGSFVLDSKFGFSQGFSLYDDDFEIEKATLTKYKSWGGEKVDKGFDQRADVTTQKAISVLKKYGNSKAPFFLFIHYFDPHLPYNPPKPFSSMFMQKGSQLSDIEEQIRLYDGEVAYTDHELGSLFKALDQMKLEDNTLVVITSDHGEGLGQHDHMGHAINIYEETVRVPLIFRWPGHVPQGHVLNGPVEVTDLVPTIFDLIGIKIDPLFQGRSLASTLCGESAIDTNRSIYLYRQDYKGSFKKLLFDREIWLEGEKFGVRTGKWKYIEGPKEKTKELFDLENDPGELINRYKVFPDKVTELQTKLDIWKSTYSRSTPVDKKISAEDLSRLKSLGYIE